MVKKTRSRKLIYRSKLGNGKLTRLMELFAGGVTARTAARICGVNRNTATRIFRVIRERIAWERRRGMKKFEGRAEMDECYLSGGAGGRKSVAQGRGLAGKIAVVGIAQREPESKCRRVFFKRVENVGSQNLLALAKTFVADGSEIHTDFFAAYNKLKTLGFVHKRVNHSRCFKSRDGACTNLIEGAWSVLKRHLARFCGGWRENFDLWLKEAEMRYECGSAAFFSALKNLFRPPA